MAVQIIRDTQGGFKKVPRDLFSCFKLLILMLFEVKKSCLRARFGFKRQFLSTFISPFNAFRS